MDIKFGTGGWRAVIGDTFTKKNIQLLAQGMVNKMQSEGVAEQGIVMGYDRRFLSKEAMQWSAEVFAAAKDQMLPGQQIVTDTAYHVLCDETRAAVWHDGHGEPQSGNL